MSDILDRVRPKGATVNDLRIALLALDAERAAAEQRKVAQTEARNALLLTGTTAQLRKAEESIKDAEIDMLRLDAMRPELQRRLTEAVAREQADTRGTEVRNAAALIERFNKWAATEYEPLAAALAEGMRMEREAVRAIDRLRHPVTHSVPDGLPLLARAHVRSTERAFGLLVRLPSAIPGAEPHWWQ